MAVIAFVSMPEWLRGQTRNLMGFARVGSNPAANDSWLDGRAVQGASFRHWSLRRRGFESHSNHMFCPFFCPKNGPILNLVPPAETTNTVGWPSGPRRQFKALVSSEAWVRIPLQSYIPVSLVGQDTRLSPVRPGFKSRTGNIFFFSIWAAPARAQNEVQVGVVRRYRACVPPELRWQSGRLLTARSSVRSRVEAHIFLCFLPTI